MMPAKTLYDLNPGDYALVQSLTTPENMRRRLLDIGLVPHTLVQCVGRSPLGDPSAYLIRGAVIALRSEDSSTIHIQEVAHGRK